MKSGIRFDKKNYIGFELWGMMLLIVWGMHGNCYGKMNTVLRFGKMSLCGFGIEIEHQFLNTRIGINKFLYWNSEHLAYWFGQKYTENSSEYRICHFFGKHIVC